MVGTLEQVAISVVLSVPLAIATAVYLSEVRGRLARLVRTVVEAMSAVPTIVAGLFIYSMLILKFGQERSGFAASLLTKRKRRSSSSPVLARGRRRTCACGR